LISKCSCGGAALNTNNIFYNLGLLASQPKNKNLLYEPFFMIDDAQFYMKRNECNLLTLF